MIRQEHRKSRKGCSRCKKRRVKCDEQIPCRNCVRRKEECDLLYPKPSSDDGSCSTCLTRESTVSWSQEIFLMHHFTATVSVSLAPNLSWQHFMQTVFPELGSKHPFLMQAILGVSALHLVATRPAERAEWFALAVHHGTNSSSQLRAMLPTVNASNCHALLAMSIVMCVQSLSYTSYGVPLAPGETLQISDVVETINIVRGTSDIIFTGARWLLEGPFSLILNHPGFYWSTESLKHPSTSTIAKQFGDLYAMTRKLCTSTSDQEALADALIALEAIYREAANQDVQALVANPGIIHKFPAMVSSQFMTLIREHHGGALVILAYFAALVGVMENNGLWYFQGYAGRIIPAIAAGIDEGWKEYLQWPKDQIGKGGALLQHLQENVVPITQ